MNGKVALLVCLALLGGGISPARATPFVQEAPSPSSASLSAKEKLDGAWLWDFLHPWCGPRTNLVDCATGSTLLAGSSEGTPAGMGTSISARPERTDASVVSAFVDQALTLLALLGCSPSRLPAILLQAPSPKDRTQTAVILETSKNPGCSTLCLRVPTSLTVHRFSSRLYRPPRALTTLLLS
jgi:hypothetical protein